MDNTNYITRENLPSNLHYKPTTDINPNKVVCLCGGEIFAPVYDYTWVQIEIGYEEPRYQPIIRGFIEKHKDCK